MFPRVLVVAGSDSGGGAGIQGDIKAITANHAYAATALTALTAQNTLGVQAIQPVPIAFIRQQITSVLTDIGADIIKTGMLHSAEVIEAVAETLTRYAPDVPLVVDPVMVAKGGASLLQHEAIIALKRHLLPRALLITPNVPEAEVLAGRNIRTLTEMEEAAGMLISYGASSVLLKGGHLDDGPEVTDILVTQTGVERFTHPRLATRHTHGTGCTLASAISAQLARGVALSGAVAAARQYVFRALLNAPQIGKGHGPLQHHVRAE